MAVIQTVRDLIAALSAYDPGLPVGAATAGGAVVPLVFTAEEMRGPHPGWEAETGLAAVGFPLGSDAALYHERRGGVLRAVVVVQPGYGGGPDR